MLSRRPLGVFALTPEMKNADPIRAAQAYIHAGLKVIVTHGVKKNGKCTCGDRSCPHAGKHPIGKFFPKGALSATTDMTLIRRAFLDVPRANLAITLENLTVIDVDGPEGKDSVCAQNFPPTLKVETARGTHSYFSGNPLGGSFKAKQVDVLNGSNRYVMAPPSRHESGHVYRWMYSATERISEVPLKITQLKPARITEVQNRGRKIGTGQRNDFLFRTACSLRRRIHNDAVLLEVISLLNDKLCEQPLRDTELHTLVTSSGRYRDEKPLFGSPEHTEPLPMDYLWYPYIPRYGVTILAGDPGRGKSLLVALLIAIVTSGGNWPLSKEKPSGKKVLLLSAEDNWARVTLHRLKKAGADISNIRTMQRFRTLTDDNLDELAQEINTFGPDLVVIDTLSAYMGSGRDMHRQNDVGEFLARLTEMADTNGCAILGLAHLNKQSNEIPLYRIVGSIGFLASIRSALFLGTDPVDRTRLALAHAKANSSGTSATIIFEKKGGGRNDVPVLRPVCLSDAGPEEVCKIERNDVGRPSREGVEARQFILGYLQANQPTDWASLQRAAEARSIASPATLNIIRAELAKSKQIVQIGKARSARWKLGKHVVESESL